MLCDDSERYSDSFGKAVVDWWDHFFGRHEPLDSTPLQDDVVAFVFENISYNVGTFKRQLSARFSKACVYHIRLLMWHACSQLGTGCNRTSNTTCRLPRTKPMCVGRSATMVLYHRHDCRPPFMCFCFVSFGQPHPAKPLHNSHPICHACCFPSISPISPIFLHFPPFSTPPFPPIFPILLDTKSLGGEFGGGHRGTLEDGTHGSN